MPKVPKMPNDLNEPNEPNVFTGIGLLFEILVIGIYLSFGICYLEFPLTQLLREWRAAGSKQWAIDSWQ